MGRLGVVDPKSTSGRILEYFRTLGSHVSYDNLKTVVKLTVVAEYEKTMQWLAVLEPDQCGEGAAAQCTLVQRSAEQCSRSAEQQQRSIFRELVQKLAVVNLIFQM